MESEDCLVQGKESRELLRTFGVAKAGLCAHVSVELCVKNISQELVRLKPAKPLVSLTGKG